MTFVDPSRPLQQDSLSPGACEHCDVRILSICATLTPNEIAAFRKIAHPITLSARTHIFNTEGSADSIYVITEGVVRFYKLLSDGRRQIVGFALPGDFLGLSSEEGRGFSADAVTAVALCRFQRQAFSEFLDRHPQMLRRLHDMAMRDLNLAQQQMVLLGRQDAEQRIASFLLTLQQRWAHIHKRQSVTIDLPMGRQDIADYLGLTIETVSRTLNRMAREKTLVLVPNGVRLLDFAKMEAIAFR